MTDASRRRNRFHRLFAERAPNGGAAARGAARSARPLTRPSPPKRSRRRCLFRAVSWQGRLVRPCSSSPRAWRISIATDSSGSSTSCSCSPTGYEGGGAQVEGGALRHIVTRFTKWRIAPPHPSVIHRGRGPGHLWQCSAHGPPSNEHVAGLRCVVHGRAALRSWSPRSAVEPGDESNGHKP